MAADLRTRGSLIGCSIAIAIAVWGGGCNTQPTAKTKDTDQTTGVAKKLGEQKKKKDRLEIGPLKPLVDLGPAPLDEASEDEAPQAETEAPQAETKATLLVKPGHWTPTLQSMKANYEDFVGRSAIRLLDKRGKVVSLRATRDTWKMARPVLLAKGRKKHVVGALFVPEQSAAVRVESTLTDRDTGSQAYQTTLRLRRMPSYQYSLIVVAKEISRYGFLKVADAVRMSWEEESEQASEPHYRVVLADATKDLPLPDSAIGWTSIAYVVWDEVDPDRLTAEQQEAMIDWLHWGGRLIINGPDSLETLRGSFLDQWLPADSNGPRKVAADDLRRWCETWSTRTSGAAIDLLRPVQPWSGIELQPRPGARELPGGERLFFERSVGQGSAIVSAIQLTERELVNWPGFDSLVNAALLGRPRRRFAEGAYGGLQIDWADYRERRLDAHFTTGVRLFARDAATKANSRRIESTDTNQFGLQNVQVIDDIDRPGGLGAWNQFGPVAESARGALAEAAAVRVPGAGFVIVSLSLYLLVLVPLNWLVFYSLRRVEWAWIAAPVIALLGTWAIVRQARLDIGFVRSQTEIGLLELQGPYDRGWLSRYTALYSSLSTTFEVTYDDPTAVATPFSASEGFQAKAGDRLWDVVFENQRDARLSGMTVASSSTRMVQSEQMFSLAGPVHIGVSSRKQEQLENHSGFRLRDVAVVERTFDRNGRPQYRGDWIGDLRDGDSAVLVFEPLEISPGQLPFAKQRQQSADDAYGGRLDVGQVVDLAFRFPSEEDPRNATRGEYRMVAVIDEILPGTEVTPAVSQIQGATVIVAHLRYADRPDPQPDVNSPDDVLTKSSHIEP